MDLDPRPFGKSRRVCGCSVRLGDLLNHINKLTRFSLVHCSSFYIQRESPSTETKCDRRTEEQGDKEPHYKNRYTSVNRVGVV